MTETTEKKPATKATKKNIYQIINEISKEAGALAPEKSGGVPFAFRGVDAVINHLTPRLHEHGVVVIPTVLEHEVTGREVGSKYITQSKVTTRFDFFAEDGTSVSTTTVGLAQDFADRSAAQAQSVAFRVALLQTFHLPTHDKEPEARGEEIIAGTEAAAKSAPRKVVAEAPAANVNVLKAKVSELLGTRDRTEITKAGDQFFGGKPGWAESADALQKWVDALTAGK